MTRPELTDDDLRVALRELPREGASPGFTGRIAEAAQRRSTAHRWRPPLLAAAAGLTVCALLLVGPMRERNERRALARRHAELSRELAELERRASRPPTVYLAAAADYDLGIDLDRWLASESRSAGPTPVLTSRPRH